jgi:hypothetical protein
VRSAINREAVIIIMHSGKVVDAVIKVVRDDYTVDLRMADRGGVSRLLNWT